VEEFKCPVPNFSSIKDLNLDEHSEAKRNIRFNQATEEQKIAMRKHNLSKYINVEKIPNEELNLLWERCKRNKNIKPILRNTSLEAGKVTIQEFQINYRRNIFSKLSDQKRAKFKVITTLNKVLGLETSFAGNNALIKWKDFAARVKLIVKNDNVRSLFKYKCPENK